MNTLVREIVDRPEIIDLFSGCGGLSYGFLEAGFNIASGMELDKAASVTASYNLHWKQGIDREHFCMDITQNSPSVFSDYIKGDVIVIGGPPCQAYSRIGRAKLNSLGENRSPENDARGSLYKDFIRYVLELNAVGVVMENVPESVNYNGDNIPQRVCEILEENGYYAIWTVLNAADYGVPQVRERVFVIAVKKEFGKTIHLPVPTHKKYSETYNTQNELRLKTFSAFENFKLPNKVDEKTNLPSWVTVGDALSDLPVLFSNSNSPYILYKPNIKLEYSSSPKNGYQLMMRNSRNRILESVSGHGFRKTVRDFKIFEEMKCGDDYRDAVIIAERLFREACRRYRVSENSNSELYRKLKKQFIPPYDTTKFHSKWKRLDADKPSHTLVAHLSTDTYSHIHPWEPRGISVREAARLQSFPDDFLFSCSMGEAYRQIGNAVPPLLSKAIAQSLIKTLESKGELCETR